VDSGNRDMSGTASKMSEAADLRLVAHDTLHGAACAFHQTKGLSNGTVQFTNYTFILGIGADAIACCQPSEDCSSSAVSSP
jgi:hypothetical protein